MIRSAAPSGACSRCGAHPRQGQVAFSCASGRLIHTAAAAELRTDAPAICGGRVSFDDKSPAEKALVIPPRPGRLVRAHAARSAIVHRVRLGEPVSPRAGSWEGTSLCGYAPRAPRPYWHPLANQGLDDQRTQICQACEAAFNNLPERSRS